MSNDRTWEIEGFGQVRFYAPSPLIGRHKERWSLSTTGSSHRFDTGKEVVDHLNGIIERCRNAIAAIDALFFAGGGGPSHVEHVSKVVEFPRSPGAVAVCDAAMRYGARVNDSEQQEQ